MTDGARDLSTEQGPAVIADRYQLRRELGRGGAAIVWLANDLLEGRDVAVKVLRPEIANTVAAERFLEEIRIVTELSHPHLLPILGSGEWEGLLYYVTPYIEEGSLRARLDRERQLPIDDALGIVTDVADALQYAHGHDVIHRDVKPENILLAGAHAWVADFGIARALTRALGDRITSTGISVGTPAYMSPEQAAGNRDLDQRTDMYSLACVLYEMLAGVAPFVGPTPESVIAQRFVHAPHPLRGYRATISPEVERAVACAMAISPADRPRTMDGFVEALTRPAAASGTTVDLSGRASRRRRWLLGGVAAVAIAATLLATAGRRSDGRDGWLSAATGTTRPGAWRAYGRGRAALARWDLDAAIREYRAAVEQDPDYAEAQLWLSQASAWSKPDRADEWRRDAMRAGALAPRLAHGDSLLAVAVAWMGGGQYPEACGAYRRFLAEDARKDVGWLGVGQCQAMDDVVVSDSTSPSGWRFRSSYHSAAIAYDSAIAHASGAPSFAFLQLARVLFDESLRVRAGHALPPDTVSFLAHPSLAADTLAFVPFLANEVKSAAPRTLPSSFASALEKNADRLKPRYQDWVRRAPRNPSALGALAHVQEVRGEYDANAEGRLAALATYRAAVPVSSDPDQRIRLTMSVVRVLLKGEQFAEARATADSLLKANPAPKPSAASYLAGVAALIGDVGRTERLLVIMAGDPHAQPGASIPHAIAVSVARLTTDAALGVCSSRMAGDVQDVERQIERFVSAERQGVMRTMVLARPLSLAVPCLGPAVVERVADSKNPLLSMQLALARGDRRGVRAHLDTLALMRRVERVGDIALDNLYQEAWLSLALGDTARAQRQLCLPISALPTLGTRLLFEVSEAAAVGRSFALCAQLASRTNDRVASRKWAHAVTLLWAAADSSLSPVLSEMRTLAR